MCCQPDGKDEYGFCFVTGVPVTPEATEELIRRMSFIRETHCTCSLALLQLTC